MFHQFLRLPAFDAPGIGFFDGSVLTEQAVAALDPEAVAALVRKRSAPFVQSELIPVEAWVAPSEAADEATTAS